MRGAGQSGAERALLLPPWRTVPAAPGRERNRGVTQIGDNPERRGHTGVHTRAEMHTGMHNAHACRCMLRCARKGMHLHADTRTRARRARTCTCMHLHTCAYMQPCTRIHAHECMAPRSGHPGRFGPPRASHRPGCPHPGAHLGVHPAVHMQHMQQVWSPSWPVWSPQCPAFGAGGGGCLGTPKFLSWGSHRVPIPNGGCCPRRGYVPRRPISIGPWWPLTRHPGVPAHLPQASPPQPCPPPRSPSPGQEKANKKKGKKIKGRPRGGCGRRQVGAAHAAAGMNGAALV